MHLRAEWIRYASHGQAVPAFVARPRAVDEPLPGVIVIQEVWGVDGHIRDLTERFAAAGYTALAPDLYARGGRRPEALAADRVEAVKAWLDTVPPSAWMDPRQREVALDRLAEPRRGEIASTLSTLFSPGRDMAPHIADLRAAVAYLRDGPLCRGRRVGSTGYCMGGALSALLAGGEPDLAAAAIYYGTAPAVDRLSDICCPVYGFYGGDDPRITSTVPAFAEAMAAAGKRFEYQVYEGAPHAFFNDTRRSFRVEAARDAWARTLTFFARHLAAPA